MTVENLKYILSRYDDNLPVVLSIDKTVYYDNNPISITNLYCDEADSDEIHVFSSGGELQILGIINKFVD